LAAEVELQAKQIVTLTNMDKVRVSRAVSSLANKQLLKKRHCEADSRAALLSLNAAGNRLYKRIVPQALAWEQSLIQPLSQSEQKALFQIVGKLEGRLFELKEIAP
jgi:DNA-binding MarR family transcriptional regulator